LFVRARQTPPAFEPLETGGPTAVHSARDAARDSQVALDSLVSLEDLSVVFQPIVSLNDGQLFAYEALARCSRAALRNPMVLFERAVTAGCVGRLGRMIRELQEAWLVRPDDPLYSHDHDVYLEVTESVPLTHYQLCIDVLRELRARGGVKLVVDDLGAGYSNLKRIADLEPKIVKLDRGLICGVDQSPRQRRLVTSVVQLCVDLDAEVVAEGIETEDEFRALADTGAHYGQGYLFARPSYPMPAITWPPNAVAV
jgi:EAL domain-containing protein (putative c-di-GMP-specific phosphodiesterase class I)